MPALTNEVVPSRSPDQLPVLRLLHSIVNDVIVSHLLWLRMCRAWSPAIQDQFYYYTQLFSQLTDEKLWQT